jgi:uncharacterized protein with HEPN domain
MPRRKARPLLEDMLAYAREAATLVGVRPGSELLGERMRFLAASRAVEVVGEAATQVPDTVRDALPDIPFRQAAAMRNRLIHGYGTMSAAILADTVRDEFPTLTQKLEVALGGSLPDGS